MNKEKLIKELNELSLLWTGLSRIPNFPKELLELSLNKLTLIEGLCQYLEQEPLSQQATAAKTALAKEPELSAATTPSPAAISPQPAEETVHEAASATIEIEPEPSKALTEATLAPVEAESAGRPETESLPDSAASASEKPQEQTLASVKASPSTPVQQAGRPLQAKTESLVERFEKNNSKDSLQKKFVSMHFADLSKALSLNDRFRFQRELFDNSAETMNRVLQDIGTMTNLDEAQEYMQNNYAQHMETESYSDFIALIEQHFSS